MTALSTFVSSLQPVAAFMTCWETMEQLKECSQNIFSCKNRTNNNTRCIAALWTQWNYRYEFFWSRSQLLTSFFLFGFQPVWAIWPPWWWKHPKQSVLTGKAHHGIIRKIWQLWWLLSVFLFGDTKKTNLSRFLIDPLSAPTAKPHFEP